MNRAERKRQERERSKAKTVTYNLTKEQIDKMKTDAVEKAVNTAMVLLLALPLEVLMDHYWPKSYAKKIPEFTNYVLEYYRQWQDGELDMEELKKDLWEYGGVRFEERREK